MKALQFDGYNVYMYLDDNLIDTEHFCRVVHVRAKFKYALEQGEDKYVISLLERIGELDKLEREYEESQLWSE